MKWKQIEQYIYLIRISYHWLTEKFGPILMDLNWGTCKIHSTGAWVVIARLQACFRWRMLSQEYCCLSRCLARDTVHTVAWHAAQLFAALCSLGDMLCTSQYGFKNQDKQISGRQGSASWRKQSTRNLLALVQNPRDDTQWTVHRSKPCAGQYRTWAV